MAERAQVSVKKPETKRENKISQTQKTCPSQSISSPIDQILFLQRTIGNQAVGRLINSGALQAKLRIGQPGDLHEQEADRMAEQVMRMPEPQVSNETEVSNPARNNSIQRKCPGYNKGTKIEKEEEEEKLQKKEAPGSTHEVTPELESSISAFRGGGQPLPESARAFYEPRFGHDFGKVRIHDDEYSHGAANLLGAMAFTFGQHIFMDTRQYITGSETEKTVLSHELWHTVQQRSHTPAFMLLTPAQFRARLSATSQERRAIDTLFANLTFLSLWNYLRMCKAVPHQDLGPLRLKVTPGLTIGGVERFGGYNRLTRTLEINPTKLEHLSNPTELVDTVVHELIHAVDDLQADCVASGSSPAPLGGAATETPPTRSAVAGTPAEATLMIELGPGASNPCEEFIDINKAAQQMIIQILVENIQVSRVGRPTVTFVNEILRRNPAAMSEYETCRGTACAKPTANERRREVARCSTNIIGKFMPPDLSPALLPTRVYFDFGAHKLQPDSLETLHLVALFLMAHPATSVNLVGHTDPVGSTTFNLNLGHLRAEAVALELLKKGVDPKQIKSVASRGEMDRLSTNPATHWIDRRVEIKL
ncbi:MAG: DUF4157 domain-containing protein [Candidatus Methanoperedens sp.]|nr:DUF4157 domain-containing protein [Candidatus Methanoperedens sp.]MCE8427118.1 DUF4157 domain-containing protein [Candidatus Methanoperedens sp.]